MFNFRFFFSRHAFLHVFVNVSIFSLRKSNLTCPWSISYVHGITLFPNVSWQSNAMNILSVFCSQFHQRFKRAFFVRKRIFAAKILYESCILGLKFLAPKFCTKIMGEKCWWNWPLVYRNDLGQFSHRKTAVTSLE